MQAPHWLVSQPTCVPVSPRSSRRVCTRSRRGSTSTSLGIPFTVKPDLLDHESTSCWAITEETERPIRGAGAPDG